MRIDGLSFEQISAITAEPVGRLLTRMHRIKARLAKSCANGRDDMCITRRPANPAETLHNDPQVRPQIVHG